MSTLATLLTDAAARSAAGDGAGALSAYREAVKVAPERAELWHNLGALCAFQGARDEALDAFAEAARRRDTWAEPWSARGHVLFAGGDFDGARAAFEKAVTIEPTHLGARVNLALTLNRQKRWSEGVPHLAFARTQAPTDESIWWTLRGSLLLLRRDEEAFADYLRFEPNAVASSRTIVAALASARRDGDAAREARTLSAALAHPFAIGESALLAETLALVQYHDVAAETMRDLYRSYDRLVTAELAAAGDAVPLAPDAPRRFAGDDRRIRVGYVSADFREHVMGEMLAPVLAAHERKRFSVRLYSLAPAANDDAMTDAMRAGADGFTALADLDDPAAARAIASDDLDILVDLMGHSAFSRPGIVARKPARVVATHLGCHGALGLAAVDYKITDAFADVPGNAAYQQESLLPLPVCVLPLRAYVAPALRESRAALGIRPDAIVCATFVAAQKLSPRCLLLWRAILAAAPQAVLLLSPRSNDDRIALLRRLAGFGIGDDRVRIVPYVSGALHDRYALADFALDTLPYTGGDTTVAALAAGVPVVTRAGVRHAERVTASVLTHAGLSALIADSDDAYVALAVRFASDAAYRDAQRAAARAAMTRPELTDPIVYARALESAYVRALIEKRRHPA
jgi:predicted O-linked N-acetylglucosamine transferase (SPINDLY family)